MWNLWPRRHGWRPISELTADALYAALGLERGSPAAFWVSDGRREHLVEWKPLMGPKLMVNLAVHQGRFPPPRRWKPCATPGGQRTGLSFTPA